MGLREIYTPLYAGFYFLHCSKPQIDSFTKRKYSVFGSESSGSFVSTTFQREHNMLNKKFFSPILAALLVAGALTVATAPAHAGLVMSERAPVVLSPWQRLMVSLGLVMSE